MYKDKVVLFNLYAYENAVKVRFYEDVKGIVPGQRTVLYKVDDGIGRGVIQKEFLKQLKIKN